VAKDELADRPPTARIAIVQLLGLAPEGTAGQLDLDGRVGPEVRGPVALERSGGDEDRAVRLVDEPDRDRPPRAGSVAAGPQPGEPLVWRAVQGGPRVVAGRQRLRCQDLPSVATDGA
jgi:hypothetical protein